MLDLGAWMTVVQSEVEELHKNLTMQNDVLAASVDTAFENLSSRALTRIYERWGKVLNIIMKDAGDNSKVEKYCGAKSVVDLTLDGFGSSDQIQNMIEMNTRVIHQTKKMMKFKKATKMMITYWLKMTE